MLQKTRTLTAAIGCFLSIFLFLISNIGHSEQDKYIMAVTTFDKSRNAETVLTNVEGQEIARRKYNRKTNKTTIYDSSGKILYVIDWKIKNERWLCLDENGNMARGKSGKPILIKPFEAKQRHVEKVEYGSYNVITKKTFKIYPCENCAERTDKKCVYIF